MPFLTTNANRAFGLFPQIYSSVAELVQRLPERDATSSLSGTISASSVVNLVGISLNNDLKYTTIEDPVDGTRFNAIGIASYTGSASNNYNSRDSTTGHNASSMQVPNANSTYSANEAWIGTDDAQTLIYNNYQILRCCMAVIGPQFENYFMRPVGQGPLNVWSPLTTNEGTNWSQNNTAPRIKDAVDGTNFSTNKSNGPWGSGHYGPWCWNTGRSAPTQSHLLKNSIMGNAVSASADPIYIFERSSDNDPYPPQDSLYTFIFWPDYPV